MGMIAEVTNEGDKKVEPVERLRVEPALVAWIIIGITSSFFFLLSEKNTWLVEYPEGWEMPVSAWFNSFMEWFVPTFQWFFQGLAWLIGWPLKLIETTLGWLPWPATIAVFATVAYLANGWRLALFTGLAFFYMVVTGYWDESMKTLSLVFVSVPMAVTSGLFIGIWASNSKRVNRIVQPILDLMQTVPTFAYLIPILLLFGFGPVVGMIASTIYAIPPMVRSVILGLNRVPSDIIESGLMSGCTKRQLLWWVRVPTAMPTIMIGVNQAIMLALSMVIIAAIIGGSDDIGWEVLSTMRKAQFGESVLSGVVVALIAMVMDRISRKFSDRSHLTHATEATFWQRHRYLLIAAATVAVFVLLAQFIPALKSYPESLLFYPADVINDGLSYITVNYWYVLKAIKEFFVFFLLFPSQIGLRGAVQPYTWGFEMTPVLSAGFAIITAALAYYLGKKWGWRAAVAVVVLFGNWYFGITTTPWPVVILVISAIAWQVGGWRVALFASLSLLFMLLSGVWKEAMLSLYLCAAAVVTCFIVGGMIGVWAAQNDRVSAFVRPINDTLQTIPLFVLLIPVLMFFQVGEFTAYLAIVAFAIVPSIRYTEHGLRNVSHEIVEAGVSMGCTKRQMFWQIKLPLALPEIALGLNQTIMFALAMLVIAALVGTRGLGQEIYAALGRADAGAGMVAGLAMALIAMVADRICQSWSAKKKAELGMSTD